MRAVVTGGAGFLGSNLCKRLLVDGWQVVALDNLSTGLARNVGHLESHPSFSFRRGDLVHDPLPEQPADVVFHLASPASPVQYRRLALATLAVNSRGTARALELAERVGARFVLASTSEVYGDPLIHPQTEDYWGNVDPVGPRSMYDEGKRYAEAVATWFARERGADVRILRIFNTYGPWMDLWDGRVVCTFVRQALSGEPLTVHGHGRQTRSFCYVTDLIEGIVMAAVADAGEINRMPTNLGNPEEITVSRLAAEIIRLTGSVGGIRHVEPHPADPSRRQPDITRARSVLGWEPAVPLERGLGLTIEWARGQIEQFGLAPDGARSR